MQPLDLEEVVDEVVHMITPDARRRDTVVDLISGVPLPGIRGDRVHLQQVLLNLLINRMEAMSKVEPANRRLTVRTSLAPGGMVELSVTDRGHGIPKDHLQHIFDSFYSTKPDGMGLGLAISRSVVEAHGGRIIADSNADAGATFRVLLPVSDEPNGRSKN